MKNNIEKKVKEAFVNITPDSFDSVYSDCGGNNEKGNMVFMNQKSINVRLRSIISIAAALIIVLSGIIGFRIYKVNYDVASTVSLDVNPSIEIQVNEKNRVLDVVPMNEDGKTIIGEMDFRGNGLDVTVNALIGSMLKNGFISEISNSILVSVDSDDPEKSVSLREMLAAEIENLLSTSTFSGAVLTQGVTQTEELQKLAEEYGITLGKAQLINQIITQNTKYTFEDLASLTINELNLISETGNLNLENVTSTGTASDKQYIGEAKAKEIALNHAGVDSASVANYEWEMDYENGVMTYEIEFYNGGYEYDYELNAVTGEILKSHREIDDDMPGGNGNGNTNQNQNGNGGSNQNANGNQAGTAQNNNQSGASQNIGSSSSSSSSYISEASAKAAALSHAGVSESNLARYECDFDRDDGRTVYEIEFCSSGYEYDYEIDASSGSVIKYDSERCDDHRNQGSGGSGNQQQNQAQAQIIDESAAKQKAFSHAGVSEGDIYGYKCEFDRDDGIRVYEIEFHSGGYEYDCKINAVTGEVLSFERDRDD